MHFLRIDWQDPPSYIPLQPPKPPTRVSALEGPKLLQSIFSLVTSWDRSRTMLTSNDSLWNPDRIGSAMKIFEPATGKSKSRTTKFKFAGRNIEDDIWPSLRRSSQALRANGFHGEPPLWRYHPLVICDPVVPMHVSLENFHRVSACRSMTSRMRHMPSPKMRCR